MSTDTPDLHHILVLLILCTLVSLVGSRASFVIMQNSLSCVHGGKQFFYANVKFPARTSADWLLTKSLTMSDAADIGGAARVTPKE